VFYIAGNLDCTNRFFKKRFIAHRVYVLYSVYKDKLQNCSCNKFE